MTESRIKKLWRNRLSHQLSGLQFSTCITKSTSTTATEEKDYAKCPIATTVISPRTPPTSPPPSLPIHKDTKLWRKPLPNDCPVFDFDTTSEKTLYDDGSKTNTTATTIKTEIPTRCESKFYENIPNLEEQLDRACTNEKAVLLTKLLQKQRQ